MGDQKHDSEYTMTYHAVDMNPPHAILDTINLPENFFLITRIHNNKTKQNFYNVQKYNKTSVIPSNRNNVSQAEIDKYIKNGDLSNVPHYSNSINLNLATAAPANSLSPIQTPFQTSPISSRIQNDQLPEIRTTIKPNLDKLVANKTVKNGISPFKVSNTDLSVNNINSTINPNNLQTLSNANPTTSAKVLPIRKQAWEGGRKTHRNKKTKSKHTRRHQTRQKH